MRLEVFRTEAGTIGFFCLCYAFALAAGVYSGVEIAGENASVLEKGVMSTVYTLIFGFTVRMTIVELVRSWQARQIV